MADAVRVYRDSLGEYRWTRRTPTGHTTRESDTSHHTRDEAIADAVHHNTDSNYQLECART